jgi:hypothetical protein
MTKGGVTEYLLIEQRNKGIDQSQQVQQQKCKEDGLRFESSLLLDQIWQVMVNGALEECRALCERLPGLTNAFGGKGVCMGPCWRGSSAKVRVEGGPGMEEKGRERGKGEKRGR